MEIKIVTFVEKGSAKLTVPTFWQEQIQVGSRSFKFVFRCVFDLKLRGMHLTEMIHKVWVINGQNVVGVSTCEVELRYWPLLTGREQELYEI